MRALAVSAMAFALGACTTGTQTLDLRLDQLQRIEAAATQVNKDVAAGVYDPAKYDLYLMLNRSLFDRLLAGFGGTRAQFAVDGHRVDVTFDSIALAFTPGSPGATVAATARDPARNLSAGITLEARLLVESDPAAPGALYMKAAVTRIVPQVSVGRIDVTRAQFVRSLLALRIAQFTEKLPRIALPIDRQFAMGGPGGVRSVRIDTGNGSWIEGDLAYPGNQMSGAIRVEKILFLGNGVHLFANVEGL